MIAAGKGDVRTSFPDLAQGIPFSVQATPMVYLSMFDPEGPAVMPKNAAAMDPVPFLWIVGIADPIVFHGKDYVYRPRRASIRRANIWSPPACICRRRSSRAARSSSG